MTIFGWDASHFDSERGPVSPAAAHAAGAAYMTHKATEGATFIDQTFVAHMASAWNVPGLLPGAYHVLHSGNINAQVDAFLARVRIAFPGWQTRPFIVQLDCERWADDFPQAADIKAWCDRFVAVTDGTHRPIVYASRGQYGNTLRSVTEAGYPLWNAAYPSGSAGGYKALYAAGGGDGSSNWGAYSGAAPVIWQYSSTATISQGTSDANAYKGTLAQLEALTRFNQEDEVEQTELVKGWDGKVRAVQVGWVLGDFENLRDALVSAGGKGQYLDASTLGGSPLGSLAALGPFMTTVTTVLNAQAAAVQSLGEQVAALTALVQQLSGGLPTSVAITGGTITVSSGSLSTGPAA